MRMSESEKTWNFDGWADRYDEPIAADSLLYARYDEVLDAVVETAGVSPEKRVLDIGTGTGNLALRCLARGASVVGLDPSERMLIHTRQRAGGDSRAEFRRIYEPCLHIPYPDSCFDAVISTYAYHHVPHRLRRATVREMVRLLRPGGSWAVGDLVCENEQAERRALREYEWLEEEYFARIDDLRSVFAKLGMELNSLQFSPITWILWAVRPRG